MVSRSSLSIATIQRLPIFASVFVRLPAFADFPGAMTLEMALAASVSEIFYEVFQREVPTDTRERALAEALSA